MAKRDKRPTRVARSQKSSPHDDASALGNSTHNHAAVPAIVVAIFAAVLGALYWPAIDAPLVYDDSTSITHNPSIVRLWPLWGDLSAPGPLNPPRETSVSGRPLVNLSLALNYHFGQLHPRGYHITNLVLHVVSAWLLWAIVRRTLRLPRFDGQFDSCADTLAFLAALVWAVHPLGTEAVEYVTQRTELSMGVFYLATLCASLRYWSGGSASQRRLWLMAATVTCIAGMTCKEVMVTAPVVALLFERAFVAGSFREALRRSWPLYLSFSAGWLVLAALNLSAPRSFTAGFHIGVPAYVWWLTQAKVVWLYLKLAVWPWPLVIHYDLPLIESWQAAVPWLVATSLAGLLILSLLVKNTASGFLLACVPLILAPTLVVPIATEVAAERRMYLPLAALVALAVTGGYAFLQRARGARSARSKAKATNKSALLMTSAVAVILLLIYVGLTVRRLHVYRDEIALWQDTLQYSPDSIPVRMNLGLALVNAGRAPQAIEQYQIVLELEPEKAATHRNNLAYALISAGRTTEAIAQYEAALRADPESAEAHNNLAFALLSTRRPKEAVAHYRKVVELKPDYAEGHLGLGMALVASGVQEEALSEFERTVQLQPDSIAGHSRLAETRAALDQPAAAVRAAERAIELARAQGQPETARAIESWLKAYQSSAPAR
ncbi:MAG TPA: tetratricopeptide repeat protein [Pirellulales bacterium]|nr:tetratricopeptide repeat protein [Pirellulales bacterium]